MDKNYLPFEDENWSKIVDDAFSPDAEVHVFSERYQNRKERLMRKNIENTNKKPVMRKRRIAAIAAAAVITAAVPTSVYAGSKIYNAYKENTAKYQRNIVVDLGETSDADSAGAGAQVIDSGIYTMNIGWIPEDLSEDDDKGYYAGYSRYDIDDWRAVDFNFFQIDDESRTFNETLNGVASEETYETKDKAVFISGNGKDRTEVWVAFKNTKYIAEFVAYQQFSSEELHKIADGLTLEESDTETASSYKAYKEEMEQFEQQEAEAADETYSEPVINIGDKTLVSVGETAHNDDYDFNITVNSIKFQDNFDGITTEGIGIDYDYSKYLAADGTIADNVRTWYKYGDGVDTIDEVVQTETMPARVMVLDLTYENTGSEETEVCVCPSLITIDDEGNIVYDSDSRDDMYCEDTLSHLTTDDMHFSFFTEHESQKNNITSFKPGEKANVQLAFIVYEDKMSNLYLDLTSAGSGDSFIDIGSLVK